MFLIHNFGTMYVKKTARFPVKPWYIFEHFYAFVLGHLCAKVQKRNVSTLNHLYYNLETSVCLCPLQTL